VARTKRVSKRPPRGDAERLAEIARRADVGAAAGDEATEIDTQDLRWLVAKAQGDDAKARAIENEPHLSRKSEHAIEDALHLRPSAVGTIDEEAHGEADRAEHRLCRRVLQLERQIGRLRVRLRTAKRSKLDR